MKRLLAHALLLATASLGLALACGGPNSDGPSGPGQPPDDSTCETNADCPVAERPFCDGFAGCVACVLDDHCLEGQKCEDHSCVTPQACATSADCTTPAAPTCNYVLGQCTECVFASDCGENSICDQGTCQAVTGCVNSLDCPTGSVCDRDLAYCVECIADGDCDETHTCVANECIPRCDSDKDCTADGELCNGAAGYCVECVENVDCPELYHCDQGSCNVDICLAGESSCSSGLNAREVCDDDGASTHLSECAYGTTCVESGSYANCQPWICQPGSANCSSDGSRLEICGADGLGSSLEADCAGAGGICENASCTDVVCEAQKKFCDGSTVMQCNTLGTSFTSVAVCPVGQHCSEEAQGCAVNLCSPSTSVCDDNIVKTCNADGSGYQSEEIDCTDTDEVCFQGACLPKVCEPEETFCGDHDVFKCVDNGTRQQLWVSCGNNQYCEGATCKTRTCTPGQATCEGNILGTCNDLGSGVDTTDGEDCTEQEEVCWAGSCQLAECDPSQGLCLGKSRYLCTNNGTAMNLLSNCSSSQYCEVSGSTSTCKSMVCTPNAPACDVNRATTCNAIGSGYLTGGTTCESDEQCVSGTCLPVICTPNAYYCDTGNVHRCGADGTTSQRTDTCSVGEFCEDGATYCKTDLCTNGQPTCDGELVTTCAADGSGPLPGGSACPEGETCDGGACKEVYCTPGDEYCDGNYRRTCNATGTGYSNSVFCSSTYYCDMASATTTACYFDTCSSGGNTCDGETIATCGTDGGSYVSLGADCSSTDQLCDGTQCVDTLTETVGSTASASSSYCNNYRLGNRYHFSTARKLTEIRQYLNITGTSQVTWVIYEVDATTLSGYHNLVFEKLTTSTGLQYHSSGTIDFTVDPSKNYVIGVRVAGACTAYYGNLGKTYLSSGGYYYGREYESDLNAIDTTWNFTSTTYAYGQQLVFE